MKMSLFQNVNDSIHIFAEIFSKWNSMYNWIVAVFFRQRKNKQKTKIKYNKILKLFVGVAIAVASLQFGMWQTYFCFSHLKPGKIGKTLFSLCMFAILSCTSNSHSHSHSKKYNANHMQSQRIYRWATKISNKIYYNVEQNGLFIFIFFISRLSSGH